MTSGLRLADLEKSKVKGGVDLAGNDVQFTPDTPQLTRAKALVSFTESGFAISGGQARLLGGDVRLEGGTRTAQAGAARPAEFPDATMWFGPRAP